MAEFMNKHGGDYHDIIATPTNYRPSTMSIPAMIASTAKAVVTVVESLRLSSGNKPVTMSQRPRRSIPRFLLRTPPIKLMKFLPLR